MKFVQPWRTILIFPPIETADFQGLLCVGGELSSENLISAYKKGIFPWPQEGLPLLWFCPPERGILDFKDFHCPRSLLKFIRKSVFDITFDQAFEEVIKSCSSSPRGEDGGTWILPGMVDAYVKLHKEGYAHSVEAWRGGVLVGGLYGVMVNGLFSGESMFFKETNASKVCLYHWVHHLVSLGHQWMDIQMVTPVLKQFGGKLIRRELFLKRLMSHQFIDQDGKGSE